MPILKCHARLFWRTGWPFLSTILEYSGGQFVECHPRQFGRHKGRFLSDTLFSSGGQEGPSFIATRDISGLLEDSFLKATVFNFLEQE
jgi:hypothetical protein